jgi:ketosteroid isomerase-like protein
MSQANVDVIGASIDHFTTTGEPLFETMHAEIEIVDHDLPDATPQRGHDGYIRWLQEWADAWEEFSVEPEEFIDAGDDKVLLVLRMRAKGRGSGVELDRQDAIVYTMRDGLIVRQDYYNNKPEALESVGLTPP